MFILTESPFLFIAHNLQNIEPAEQLFILNNRVSKQGVLFNSSKEATSSKRS
jgi:hypothetical protein